MRLLLFIGFVLILILSDFYTLKEYQVAFPELNIKNSKWIAWGFWIFKFILWSALIWAFIQKFPAYLRNGLLIGFFSIYFGQFIILLISLTDEMRRGATWAFINLKDLFNPGTHASELNHSAGTTGANINSAKPINLSNIPDPSIPRSVFLAKSALSLGSIALIGFSTTSSRNLYDYRVRKVTIFLPNLPSEFEGIQIVQISDIHSGSFYNAKAVAKGVDLVNSLKPEMIFFTGDLVNSRADEMRDYQTIFSKLHAPLGVFSILGNHDYGDYTHWDSDLEKAGNLKTLCQIHKLMGFDLLRNENRTLKIGNQSISLLGVENWSARPEFPKHGRLNLAFKGTEESPIRLLLSHDPSHWKAEIIPSFPSIDLTLSGHTHGMQMGIRLHHFQWSPVQYIYPEWAGLYSYQKQKLYVNVGYGFLGYPGRIGMYPEITLFSLTAKDVKKTY